MKVHRRLVAALALVASVGGCQILGIVADKVAPPEVEAMYEPGKTTQLLVVAENYRAPTQSASDCDRLARLIGDQLAIKQAALVVSQEKLLLVRDLKPSQFSKMSVVDLGRAVGATQVLYIDLNGIGVGAQPGSDVLKGVAHANVKVIDVATSTVAFPKDMSEGLPITFETPMRRSSEHATTDSMRDETIVGLSGKIGRLFYKYQPSDLESVDSGS